MPVYEIESVLRSTMTVGDLRAMLEGVDDETPVLLVSDYGDYCHTKQALTIADAEVVSTAHLERSGYSHSGVALVSDEAAYEAMSDPDRDSDRDVVVLR